MKSLNTNKSNILTGISLLLLGLLFYQPFEGNSDFYHHINSGREIIEEGTFPFSDKLTHIAYGNHWVAHAWGSGVIFYILYQYLGPNSIVSLTTVTGFFTVSLIYILLRSYSLPRSIALFSTALSSVLIAARFPQRPEIFTHPFLVSLLIIDKAKEKHPRLVFLLPIIFILWTNLYGSSAILGLCLLLLLIIKQLIVDGLIVLSKEKPFYISSILAGFLTLLNPNGINSLFYISFIPSVAKYEGEWGNFDVILNQSPESYTLVYQYLILIYVLYILAFSLIYITSLSKIKQSSPFLILLSLASFLPLFALRQVPVAAILSIPLFAVLLKDKNQSIKLLILLITIIMAAALIWIKNPLDWNSSYSPQEDLVRFVKEHNLKGKSFNHQNIGSFLSWHFHPDILVFTDTRDDLFHNNQALKDLHNTQATNQSIIPLLEKYKIDLVIVDYFTHTLNYQDLFNSLDWKIVYFNDRYFVAIPTEMTQAKRLKPIDSINPFSASGANPGRELEAEKFYRNLAHSFPTNNNKLLLAKTLLALHNNPEAIAVLKTLDIPKDPSAILLKKQQHYLLLKSYLELKDCLNSEYYLNELNKDLNGNFIFSPRRKLTSTEEDLTPVYSDNCEFKPKD